MWFGVVAVLGLLSACPAPFEQQDLTAGFDDTPPEITLTHPADGDSYGSALLVSGTVHDTASGGSGEVASLHCAVTSLMPETAITDIDDDGTFQFLVDCGQFSGSIVLEITARDWNGNATVLNVNLVDTESDIPSFALTPGNGKIDVAWSEVAGAESYTLYDYVSGFSIDLASNETSYEYTGLPDEALRNGDLVLLQLKAEMGADYRDAWSDAETCVALSQFTLMPHTLSSEGSIFVEWYDAPAVERYTVLRSTSRDPDTFVVHRVVNDNSFVDTDVVVGETYFYKVHPNDQEEIVSREIAGAAQSIPTLGLHVAEIVPSPTYGARISLVEDGTLFVIDRGGGTFGSGGVYQYDLTAPSDPVLEDTYEGITIDWDGYCAAIDDDGFLYIQTKDDDAGENGLLVLDTSSGLTEINHFNTGTDAYQFAIVGDDFYFAHGTDADSFRRVSTDDLTSPTSDVVTDLASYTEITEASLSVDFDNPWVLTTYTSGGTTYMYLCDSWSDSLGDELYEAIQLFRITLDASGSPVSAAQIGTNVFDDAGWADPPDGDVYFPSYLAANEDVLVIVSSHQSSTDPYSALAIYDLSADAASPVYASSIEVDSYAGMPAIDDGKLILPGGAEAATLVYDISNPATPELIQTISMPSAQPAYVAATSTNYYVAADFPGTYVLDKGVPAADTPVDVTPSGLSSPLFSTVSIEGDVAYAMDSAGTLYALDLSNGPQNPTLADSLDLNLPAPDFVWADSIFDFGTLVPVVSATAGIVLVDASDPADLVNLGTILENNKPRSAVRYGDVLFAGCEDGGIVAVDISHPEDPVILNSTPVPGLPYMPTRSDATIFYAISSGILVSVDISDPYKHEIIDTVDLLDGVASVSDPFTISTASAGDYVYFGYFDTSGSADSALGIVDAKTPDALEDLTTGANTVEYGYDGETDIPIQTVRVSDTVLIALSYYLDEGSGAPSADHYGAHLISIADPERPILVASIDAFSPLTYSADWFGTWGYFADAVNGLMFADLGE